VEVQKASLKMERVSQLIENYIVNVLLVRCWTNT
jgi:hypothetical protein